METSKPFNPPPGEAIELAPGLRRIVAPNPSPMTYRGTNTYLVGTRGVAVIDPGPASQAHLDAIKAALGPEQHISHIFVTHAHADHSPLAAPLAQDTGAPVLAFGRAADGRSAVMQRLAASGLVAGGEGIDAAFSPDVTLADGETTTGDGWALEAIHTPGHIGNHLSFGWRDLCFTGDHVMGWASSLVSPPDGDLTDFMASCAKLRARTWQTFLPGHGDSVGDPAGRLDWLIAHRKERERGILDHLKTGRGTAAELAKAIYKDTPAGLLPAAERNVLAHLIDLHERGLVKTDVLSASAVFEAA